MSKKEICTGRAAAYISAFSGIEIFKIDYTPDGEQVYYTAGAWTGHPTAHRARDKTEREKAAAEVPEKFRTIIAKLLTMPYIQVEIIGGCIWLSGNTALYLRKIQQLGFLYSKKQKRYYLPDETTSGRRGTRYSMDAIRDRYGSQIIDNPSRAKFLS